MSSKEKSAPAYANSDRKKEDYPWYRENISKYLTPDTREFLEKYAKIPVEEQVRHVDEIREQAWAISSYPCTGLGVFLVPYLPSSPAYPAIIERLQSGAKLMDIGCFLCFDLRRLVFDGAPSENVYGVDIVNHWDVGFEMFRDRETFKGHFVQADILSSEKNDELEKLEWSMDVILIAAVLHQWNWAHQVAAAKKLVGFSKVGSLVVGEQIGTENAREIANPKWKCPQWRHSPDSFKRMWKEVGEETGTAWKTEGRLRTFEERGWDPEDARWMESGVLVIDWVVTRIS